MTKGGYQIVDFKKHNFIPLTGDTVEGIYKSIDNTTKPYIITGLVYNNVNYGNLWANFILADGIYIAVIPMAITNDEYGFLVITVSNDDLVIMASGTES